MMVPPSHRDRGYHRIPALRGYQTLLEAYQVLYPALTVKQTQGLTKVRGIINDLQTDFQQSGGNYPTPEIASRYARDKMIELKDKGEIYLLSGHDTHFNITKLTRSPEGIYSYTLYDAGHETEVVRYENKKAIAYAVSERGILPHTRVEDLIVADVLKRGANCNSSRYQELKSIIDTALELEPRRHYEDHAQRRGNCTTRGQRILMNDILEDPVLSQHIYIFISDIDDPSTGDIEAALEKRLEILNARKEKIILGRNDRDSSMDAILKRAGESRNYDMADIAV